MAVELADLNVDALRDLASIREVDGHTGMTRDELLAALDGPVEDALARWLGRPRAEIFAAAGEAGVEGRKEMAKRALLEALAARG